MAYTRLRFDWEEAKSPIQKTRVVQELYKHAVNLSGFCGTQEGLLCQVKKWEFPQAGFSQSVIALYGLSKALS